MALIPSLSFSGTKTKSKTDIDKTTTESGTQSGLSNTNSTTTGSQNTNTNSQTSSQGTSTTNQSGATTSQGTGLQQQTSQTNQFSDPVLSGLESAVTGLLGGVGPSGIGAGVQGGIDQLLSFNPTDYVNSGVQAAKGSIQTGLDESIGGVLDAVGGQNNSMVALLKNRLEGNAAGQLAGVTNDLTQQANQILQGGVATAAGAEAQGNQLLTQLTELLKGGSTTSSGQTATQTAESGTSQQSGTTNTSENSTTATQQQQQTLQTLVQIIDQMMKTDSTTKEVGTTTTKGSQVGVSAGIGAK